MSSAREEFKPGELFVYVCGTRWELGTVKRKIDRDTYACWYTMGDTAAMTPVEAMYKLDNAGATHIEGKINEVVHNLVSYYNTDAHSWPVTG